MRSYVLAMFSTFNLLNFIVLGGICGMDRLSRLAADTTSRASSSRNPSSRFTWRISPSSASLTRVASRATSQLKTQTHVIARKFPFCSKHVNVNYITTTELCWHWKLKWIASDQKLTRYTFSR